MLKPQRTQRPQRKNSMGCRPRSHYDILPNHAASRPKPQPSKYLSWSSFAIFSFGRKPSSFINLAPVLRANSATRIDSSCQLVLLHGRHRIWRIHPLPPASASAMLRHPFRQQQSADFDESPWFGVVAGRILRCADLREHVAGQDYPPRRAHALCRDVHGLAAKDVAGEYPAPARPVVQNERPEAAEHADRRARLKRRVEAHLGLWRNGISKGALREVSGSQQAPIRPSRPCKARIPFASSKTSA